MKLTKEQLRSIILEELKEAYGDLGPDDDTEQEYHGSPSWQADQDDANRSREFDRQADRQEKQDEFIKTQYMNWVKELGRGNPEDLEKIVEVLDEAYDKLGEYFQLDGYVDF